MYLKKIHHVAKVVENISEELKKYSSLGFIIDNEIYTDLTQKVKVGKVSTPEGIIIELLEPLNENSPIYNFSQKQKGFHHVCVEVKSIEKYLNFIKENNLGFQLTKITTCIFEKRKVCFISTKDKEIIEIME
ncbi:MAG: VOC family protein [archaeon]